MAKHRFQRTRTTQAAQFLLIAGLVLGWGVASAWAGQSPAMGALRNAKALATGEKKPEGKTTRAKSARTPAQRKGAEERSRSSALSAGRRDPFKLPEFGNGKGVPGNIPGYAAGVLPPGVRGLIISQLRFEGAVREQSTNKMIAVVTNERNLAYFLHENESVYNGVVSKITLDSVYFRENVLDPSGRVTTREVVKRLRSAPGEGR